MIPRVKFEKISGYMAVKAFIRANDFINGYVMTLTKA